MKRPILLFAVVALLALLVAPSCKRQTAGPGGGRPGANANTPGPGTPTQRYFGPPPTIYQPTARPGEPTRLPELPG